MNAPLALPKLRSTALADVLAMATLQPAATALAAGHPDAASAILALRDAGMVGEAARLAAFALPKREAVWWACMCARAVPARDLSHDDLAALERAEAWVYQGEDATRRAAFAAAQAAGFGTPECWAGVAAFWSGDNVAPENEAAMPPSPALAGTAVAGSVALASVRQPPERRNLRLAMFLESAFDIANGGPGRLVPETP